MLLTIFLVGFFFLGVALGPLLLAIYGSALSDGRGTALSRWTFKLGLTSIYRPAITFNPIGELTLKKRKYDEEHDHEYVVFGGLMSKVKRYLHDPQRRIHPFYGVPFGFVDELFGVVVDPRDCAVGRELRHHQENDVYEYRAERDNRLYEGFRAVFELPRGGVGVSLTEVHRLVGGSFSSQIVDAIRDLYETSQSPKSTRSGVLRLLAPVGAFAAVVILGIFAASQGVGGGGGGGAPGVPSGNTSTISVGTGLLLLLIGLSKPDLSELSIPWPPSGGGPSAPDINWRDAAVATVSLLVFGGLTLGLYVALPFPFRLLFMTLPLGVWGVVLLAVGIVTLPFVAFWFGRGLGPVGMALGTLFIILGLLRFDKPVFRFDAGEYGVVEYADHDWEVEPSWHRFAFSRVGIGMKNVPGNWPRGTTLTEDDLDTIEPEPSLPAATGHVATPDISIGNIYGMLPTDIVDTDGTALKTDGGEEDAEPGDVLVRPDRTTGWLYDAGQSLRLMQTALQVAKQELGGGTEPISDRAVVGGVLAGIVFGIIFNVVVIF